MSPVVSQNGMFADLNHLPSLVTYHSMHSLHLWFQKSLAFVGTESITGINMKKTFELYYIADVDLTTNPISENAKDLRTQANVCDITFNAYIDGTDSQDYIEGVIQGMDTNCGISVCNDTECEHVTDGCDPANNDCSIQGYKVMLTTLIDT